MAPVISGVDAIHAQLWMSRWIDFSEADGKNAEGAVSVWAPTTELRQNRFGRSPTR